MTNSDLAGLIARTNELLEVLVRLQMQSVLEQELSDPTHRRLYELTGKKKSAVLTKELKISATTLSRLWQRWEDLGLLVREGRTYRKVLEQ